MLTSIELNQGVMLQGATLLIDIGLALALSILFQRILERFAPEVEFTSKASLAVVTYREVGGLDSPL